MTHEEEREELIDALDHIVRVVNRSCNQTRRLMWIASRAQSAIDGNDNWRDLDLPQNRKKSRKEVHLTGIIKTLKTEIEVLKAR